jgi:hypothetical protein
LQRVERRRTWRPVDADEEVELSFGGLHLGDVDVKEPDGVALELLPLGLVALDIRQPRDAMALQAAMQRRPGQVRDRRLQGIEAVIQRQQRVAPERHDRASSASVRMVDRGSVGPVFRSSTVARLRHFATVLGLMPSSRLSCASEACDRCIAALTACVVVALP